MSEGAPKIEDIVKSTEAGAFSQLSGKVTEAIRSFLGDESMNTEAFTRSLEGLPGRDAFYKRLRRGTKINILRSNGTMDNEGWIIDPEEGEQVQLDDSACIRVHNKSLHLEKHIYLRELLEWNI